MLKITASTISCQKMVGNNSTDIRDVELARHMGAAIALY